MDGAGSMCVAACHSLGDVGGLLFTVLAIGWGAWQAHQRTKAVKAVVSVTAEKDRAVTQLAQSLRPGPIAMPSLPADLAAGLQTVKSLTPLPPLPQEADRESGG